MMSHLCIFFTHIPHTHLFCFISSRLISFFSLFTTLSVSHFCFTYAYCILLSTLSQFVSVILIILSSHVVSAFSPPFYISYLQYVIIFFLPSCFLTLSLSHVTSSCLIFSPHLSALLIFAQTCISI